MPPDQQHLVVLIEHCREGYCLQPYNVVPEPASVRRLDLDLDEAHPLVVIDGSLAVDPRRRRFGYLVGHEAEGDRTLNGRRDREPRISYAA